MKTFIKNNFATILTYAIFLIGVTFCCLSRFSYNIFFSVFIYPTCFLIFSRRTNAKIGLPLIYCGLVIGWGVGLSNALESPIIDIGVSFAIAIVYLIPFLVDKLVVCNFFKTSKWLQPLMFALLWVTIDVIISFQPFGNVSSIAYSLCQVLHLCGILSLFGLNFLTLIIIYFDACIADFIENRKIKKLIPCIVALSFASVYGGIYGMYPTTNTLNKAKVMTTICPEINSDKPLSYEETKEDLLSCVNRAHSNSINANILATAEECFYIKESKRDSFKTFCLNNCTFDDLCVIIGVRLIQDNNEQKFRNEAWIFGKGLHNKPKEVYFYTYVKVHPVPGAESGMIIGDGTIPLVDTPFGKISVVICLDLEFEHYVSTVGRNGADILIAPSWDWDTVPTNHSLTNAFRAVENGVNFIRPVKCGYSIATDYKGNIISQFYTGNISEQEDHVFYIPTKGIFTLYPYLSFFIDYLYPVAYLTILGYCIYSRNKNKAKS